MGKTSLRPAPYAELLRRVFDLSGRGLSKPLAESILCLDFREHDAIRAAELNAKANEGLLTDAGSEGFEIYANITDLLPYWQLKATEPQEPEPDTFGSVCGNRR